MGPYVKYKKVQKTKTGVTYFCSKGLGFALHSSTHWPDILFFYSF